MKIFRIPYIVSREPHRQWIDAEPPGPGYRLEFIEWPNEAMPAAYVYWREELPTEGLPT